MRTTALAALLAAVTALVSAGAAGAATPQPCGNAGLRCLTVDVPLDYADPASGTLGLGVQLLPGQAGRGAVVVLTGGPGQAGLASAGGADAMRDIARITGRRTVISVDQRGTGTTALRCAVADRPAGAARADLTSSAAAAAACARELGERRAFYTTGQSVQDLERIREALGLARWSVGGVSYGTFVASSYARVAPERVERLLLDSTLPLEGSRALDLEPFEAARRITAGLCSGSACPGVGRLPATTSRLVGVLERRAVPGAVVDASGRATRQPFGGPRARGALIGALQSGDLSPAARAAFPAGVRAALRGDATLLNRLSQAGDGASAGPGDFSTALFLATTCDETRVPWSGADPADVRRTAFIGELDAVPPGRFAPFRRTEALGFGPWTLCLGWPEANLYQAPAGDIPATIPTLILSGAEDVRTPTESARRVAARAPGSTLVVVPRRGHSLLTQGERCVEAAVGRFFSGRTVAGSICAGTARLIEPYPVPPARFADLPPARGFDGRTGRTLTAVARTIEDIDPSLQLAPDPGGTTVRSTGLRGGRVIARFSSRAVRVSLRGFSYVPGVTVTGGLRSGPLGPAGTTLRIGGPAAARGTLALAPGGELRGTLGGRPVRARIVASGVVRIPGT